MRPTGSIVATLRLPGGEKSVPVMPGLSEVHGRIRGGDALSGGEDQAEWRRRVGALWALPSSGMPWVHRALANELRGAVSL